MDDAEKKVAAAHEKHAWTLAFMVFAAFGVCVYLLDGWLHTHRRAAWSQIAEFALYLVSFFAVFALSTVKDWFMDRLHKSPD